ncbi:MAG: histidine kinase [Chloroflexi bacterium]|nr:histidine kinase [Chloroflexota bacterium]
MNYKQLVEEIRDRIKEIKKSLPAHSIPASMLIELEELEEELMRLENRASGDNNAEA